MTLAPSLPDVAVTLVAVDLLPLRQTVLGEALESFPQLTLRHAQVTGENGRSGEDRVRQVRLQEALVRLLPRHSLGCLHVLRISDRDERMGHVLLVTLEDLGEQ